MKKSQKKVDAFVIYFNFNDKKVLMLFDIIIIDYKNEHNLI